MKSAWDLLPEDRFYLLKDYAQDKGLNNAQDFGEFWNAGSIDYQSSPKAVRQNPLQPSM